MQFFNSNLSQNSIYVGSSGPWLFDENKRAVFDTWLGAGTLILGHCKNKECFPIKMLPDGLRISNKQKELLENLVDFNIGGIGFQTSGSSAVTRAIRLARAITGKNEIVVVGSFWHGSEDEFLFKEHKAILSSGIPNLSQKNIIWVESLEVAFKNLDPLSTAAIIIEPHQGSDPSTNTLSYLSNEMRKLLRSSNVLLICDEIINGCREQYGSCFASRTADPDIVILGKSIARGFPIGLVIVSEEVLDTDKKLPFWGGTFSASPVQIGCMFDTLKQLSTLNYQDLTTNLEELMRRLTEHVEIFGLEITIGCNFARIKRGSSPSARAFVEQEYLFEEFRESIQIQKAIYVARNGLVFPSVFNIAQELPSN